MKGLLYITAALLLVATSVQAQKIDARLTALLPNDNKTMSIGGESQNQKIDTAAVKQRINVRFNSDCTARSFSAIAMVKEGFPCPADRLQELGVEIVREIGRMLILCVPAESLAALEDIEEIESVSADQMNYLTNNYARQKSKVTEVATVEKAQQHNLPQAYTGKGVLVGIVDGGIDFQHVAFRNPDGSSRVKLAMITKGFDKLTVYDDPKDIPHLTTDFTEMSHGTHVAGTAAGSIVETLNKQGIATEADLMLCGLANDRYDANIILAITEMFKFAKQQGKPCVINVSIGNVCGFHDGVSSLVVQGLREYFKTEDDKKGRICVFSASNSAGMHGAIYTALPAAGTDGYNLRSVLGETEKAKHEGVDVSSYTDIYNYFYYLDGSEFDVDVKVVDVKTGAVYTLAEKPLYDANENAVTALYKEATYSPRNNKFFVHYQLDNTHKFHEPNLRLAYFVKGTQGKTLRAFELREDKTAGYHSENLQGYTEGSDNGAFNVHATGDEVISVGAYYSAIAYLNIKNEFYGYGDVTMQDKITPYSSWGTDDNGVNHPDLIAPGGQVCSAYNIYDTNCFDEEGRYYETVSEKLSDGVTAFGRNHYYGSMEGTSMAAPHTTGIIALWLQAKPDLTYADVRKLIKDTSSKDKNVTDPEFIPSGNVIQAGAGKIDALAGLEVLAGSTAISTVAADGYRQATPATMYDIDDHCYNTLGQRVSKNAKGLVIYKGKVYLNR